MRRQFVSTVSGTMATDRRLALLLGDIGVFGFREAFARFPERVFNIGILEQSTVGFAAGLAIEGLIPVVHTIAPFLVERAFEQLKIDFCYQGLGGNFVSVGGSYDYAALGCTHHCPGDVPILRTLPRMQIVVPGTSAEFHTLFGQAYANGHPTYFRLSERENPAGFPVQFGAAFCCRTGTEATVVAVGPMLAPVLEAARDLDVTILYYATVSPFDSAALKNFLTRARVLLCEPYYSGTLAEEVLNASAPHPLRLATIGVPRLFLTHYGSAEEHDEALGLTASAIRSRLEDLIRA